MRFPFGHHDAVPHRRAAGRLTLCVLAGVVGGHATAHAQAMAGRDIVNVARVSFVVDGRAGTVESNVVRDRVAELIEVGAAPVLSAPTPAADGERDRAVAFRLTNAGNGAEAFSLRLISTSAAEAGAPPTCDRIALDSDDDGQFTAADASYEPGKEPRIAPGGSTLVYVLCDVPDHAADGDMAAIRLEAVALTGTGAPGAVFVGKGEDGVDAVVGRNSGTAAADTSLRVELGRPELVKAHVVRDGRGGARVISGAVVTFTTTARLAGRGVAREVSLQDPIPDGSEYVPGSLRLDGLEVSDAEDGDSGRVSDGAVEVALGELRPDHARTVSFQVRVQ